MESILMPFDPSIILGFKQYTGPDANETMRTLSQLALQGVQQRHAEATLADLAYQRQRQMTADDVTRQYATAPPEQLVQAFRKKGLTKEAQDAEAHAAEVQNHRAQYDYHMSQVDEATRKREHEQNTFIASTVGDATTPEEWEAGKVFLRQQGVPAQKIDALGDFTPGKPKIIKNMVIAPDKQMEAAETERHHREEEKRPAGVPILVQGQDGSQFLAPRVGGPAKQILDENGNPILKPAAGGGDKPLSQKDIEHGFQDMRKALSTTEGRSHLAQPLQQSINRAEALEALVRGPNGEVLNLVPGQVREATTALAQLISQGNAPALQQIEELTPHTMAGDLAKFKQKWMNEPTGADAQKFLSQILETAAREKAVAMKQIRNAQLQNLPAFSHLRKADKKKFDAMLRAPGIGIDPSTIGDDGLVVEPSSGSAPALKPNEVLLKDPSGVPHAVDKSEVDDALAHKWTRA